MRLLPYGRLIAPGILAGLSGSAYAQTPAPPVFRSEVEAVFVDAFVTHEGKPVAGLSASDFDLRDGGVPQEVELVSADSRPIVAVLVCDTSSSTEGEELVALQEAAATLLEALRPEDRAGLMGFSEEIAWLTSPTADKGAVRSALEELHADGTTAAFDALYAAVALTDALRPLVVLFTDGDDDASWLGPRQLREMVERSTALVDIVAWRPSTFGLSPRPPSQTQQTLREVADSVGGQVLTADSPARLKEAFGAVIDSMRNRYVLRYSPTSVPRVGWHKIEVRLKSQKAEVRARRGYWVSQR